MRIAAGLWAGAVALFTIAATQDEHHVHLALYAWGYLLGLVAAVTTIWTLTRRCIERATSRNAEMTADAVGEVMADYIHAGSPSTDGDGGREGRRRRTNGDAYSSG